MTFNETIDQIKQLVGHEMPTTLCDMLGEKPWTYAVPAHFNAVMAALPDNELTMWQDWMLERVADIYRMQTALDILEKDDE